MMKKSIKELLIMAAVGITTLTGCLAKGTPADDWIVSRYDSLADLKAYLEKLDDTVTLYLTSAIDSDTYLANLKELDTEFCQLEVSIPDDTIKPGSMTETTAAAQEAYDDIWYNMETLLKTMQTDRKVQNKDALSYLYLAYQTKLSEDFSKYAAGYNEVIKKREKDGS